LKLFGLDHNHDRKYKHKDNAHKYKGWRERGYKIITETEFVDRGEKLDTGYKKHEKGKSEHIKEHSAKDSGRGDKRKYYKNIKQVNKNYESQYGNQHQSSMSLLFCLDHYSIQLEDSFKSTLVL